MYTVTDADETTEFEDRGDAVEHARDASRACRYRITITGTEGPVRMVYQRGELVEYEMQTRRRR